MLDTSRDCVNKCWFMQPSAFVIGGKAGDCVQMVAAFHAISDRTSQPVNVVCSETYASIFDGCSFVNAVSVPVPWDTGLPKMKAVAQDRFGGGTPLQFWHDVTSPEFKNTRGGIALQIHGKHFKVDTAIDPHYSASMFRRAGFTWPEALTLRPVFDQRDSKRESVLLNRCWPDAKRNKPMLLVALDAQSSPWGYLPEAYPILNPLYRHFHVVDIGKLKCVRVYDMLTLFENAVGLITVDTLALHLAATTNLPYCAFTQNDWVGSVPKGNCVLRIPYKDTIRRLPDLRKTVESWARASKSSMLVSQG